MNSAGIYQHYREYPSGYENCGQGPFIPRTYAEYPPAWVVTVCHWFGNAGYQVASEDRPDSVVDIYPRVHAVRCADSAHLLAAVADVAHRLAAAPSAPLRVVVDDGIDSGLAARAAFLLLCGHHAGAHDAREAA